MKNKTEKKEPYLKKSFNYLWFYLKQYKGQFLFVVISSILVSALNAGVIVGQYFFNDFLQKEIGQTGTNHQVIIFMSMLLVGIVSIGIIFVVQTIFMTRIAQYAGKLIRKDLYFKILELKLSYFDQNPSGDIMSRLTNDINNITNALTQNVTQFLINSTQIFFMMLAMFLFSPILASITLAIAPIQIGVVLLLFKRAQPNFLKKQVALGEINGFIEETISGQKVINNFNKKEQVIKAFDVKNNKIKNIDYSTQALSSLVNPWNTFISSFSLALVLILSTVFLKHNIEIGGIIKTQKGTDQQMFIAINSLMMAMMLLIRNYSNPIYQIFQMLYLLQGALAGTERAFVIKDQQNEVIPQEETIEINNVKGDIVFKNLNFSYDGKRNVLKNIDLHAKPGQVIGIVGPTGSGKTTIINLLTKFYDVSDEESDILIDGTSIKNITKNSLRDEVSIVLQDTFVFGETIYENIRYAKPDATNEEIEAAAKSANAHHFITALDKGYETVLENNADELSQGEKQLLAIARAFLKQSSILILDEATSSIDSKTEKQIQSAMINLSKGKTTFMIAHRLSTIKHADKIVVLKDGSILEKGNHFELLAKNGFYANMYNSKLNTPEDV